MLRSGKSSSRIDLKIGEINPEFLLDFDSRISTEVSRSSFWIAFPGDGADINRNGLEPAVLPAHRLVRTIVSGGKR